MKRIAVVGAGPVGGVLCAHLIKAKLASPTIIENWLEYLQEIRKNGIVIKGVREISVPIKNAFQSISEASQAGCTFDMVFLCVKAPVNKEIAAMLPTILSKEGTVICFQNGLDTERAISEYVDNQRILRGVVNYAGNMEGFEIKMNFFNPPNYIGPPPWGFTECSRLGRDTAELLSEAGLATEYVEDIQREVWKKTIRNASLTPISALSGMTISQVMSNPRSRFIVEKLMFEALSVARAMGFDIDDTFIQETISYLERAGSHMPSMRVDITSKRKTEVEFLNHKIAEHGEKLGIDVSYNRAIANLILSIDDMAQT